MLRSLDFFRKIQSDQQLTSSTGGAFTIVSLIVAALLIIYSFQQFYEVKYYTFLAVRKDTTDFIPMRIDMTFSLLPCEALSIDFHDQLKFSEKGLERKLTMYNIPMNSTEGELYNRSANRQAEKNELIKHIKEKYKCRLVGILPLPKTPGSITITSEASDNLLDSLSNEERQSIRMSYRIDSLNFGLGNNTFDFPIAHKSKNIEKYIKQLEGNVNSRTVVQNFEKTTEKLDYFNHLKIIPVIIQSNSVNHTEDKNYRYSLRAGFIHAFHGAPKVTFMTEIEPINIVYKHHEPQFYELLRKLLAIVGGTVATIGIFNSLSHLFFSIN